MISVVGGTGTLGRLLVPRLLARGESVRVVARHEPGDGFSGDVPSAVLDVTTDDGAATAVTGARVVVSAITGLASPAGVDRIDADGNRRLVEASVAAGIERFVLLSVGQAGPDHPIPLFRAKWAAEEAVRASRLAWTIVRPSAYLETWLGLIGGPLVTGDRTVVFGHGRNPINFVSAVDVADAIERVIGDPAYRARIIDVPGPDNLTLEDLVAVTRQVTGHDGRVAHIPRALMRFLAVALLPIDRMRAGQIATALTMDVRPMAADPGTRTIAGPMTPATEVATRLFGAASRPPTGGVEHLIRF